MTVERKRAEEHTFDLLVAGGGVAGICAAIAAARKGVRTAIVQDRPMFGGNSSSEVRVVPYGCAQSHMWTCETGIVNDMLLEDRASNHEHLFTHGITNSLYDMTLGEYVRREPLLTTFLNTSVRAVDSDALDPGDPIRRRRITAVHGSQLGSEKEFVFRADQFLDATGDGTVGVLAGADWRYGREAREEFGENLAPLEADEATLGSTITMRARDIGQPVEYVAPPWIEEYTTLEEIGLSRKLYHLDKPVFGGYWWLEVNNPFHQVDDNAAIRDELHRHVLGVWNYIKNHSPDKAQFANFALDWVGMIPGKRESRRLVGDVTVTEHDCHTDAKWPDGVAYAGWWIDLHIKGGILNKEEPGEREDIDDNYKHWIRVAPFTLPLRAYYSRNVENLWMAGRLLSVTHVALGPVRVQLSLGLQGQAVGTAAAYAVRHRISPRQSAAPDGPHIAEIRQELLRDDVHVFGLRNDDRADLALGATATATSEMRFDLGEPSVDAWMPLDMSRAQVVPLTHDRVDFVEYYLRNETDQPVTVVAEVQEMERIWDRFPGKAVASVSLSLPPRFSDWIKADFNAAVSPKTPHRVVLQRTAGVSWAQGARASTGMLAQHLYVCPGGAQEQNRHLPSFGHDEISIPPYEHWRQTGRISLATRIDPQPRPYAASSVNNGNAWPEDLPNIWISDPELPLPQSVDLDFGMKRTFDRVLVSFDTNLTLTTGERMALWRAPESVRDWRLHACIDGQWRLVHEERANYQRRRIARFEPVTATGLRLEALSTNGDLSARVYEIRVYGDGEEAAPERP